jgi:hypothetical protein
MSGWTTEKPTQSGYYWWREPGLPSGQDLFRFRFDPLFVAPPMGKPESGSFYSLLGRVLEWLLPHR